MIWWALILAAYGYVFWSAHRYLNPPPIHRRPTLKMTVKNGRIHYKEKRL